MCVQACVQQQAMWQPKPPSSRLNTISSKKNSHLTFRRHAHEIVIFECRESTSKWYSILCAYLLWKKSERTNAHQNDIKYSKILLRIFCQYFVVVFSRWFRSFFFLFVFSFKHVKYILTVVDRKAKKSTEKKSFFMPHIFYITIYVYKYSRIYTFTYWYCLCCVCYVFAVFLLLLLLLWINCSKHVEHTMSILMVHIRYGGAQVMSEGNWGAGDRWTGGWERHQWQTTNYSVFTFHA